MRKGNEPQLRRWETTMELPLTAAAVLFLVAYALPIINPDVSPAWRSALDWLTWGTWGVFVVDLAARLLLARERREYLRAHALDVFVVVLPMLRPLRLLRLITVLSVLNRRAGSTLRGRVVTYLVGGTGLIVTLAALAVLDAERDSADANITSFPGALWWSLTTVTTVGYGDRYPTTTEGRLVAAGLMISGIALLGVVTATFASWLLDRVREVEEESTAATRGDLDALSAEVGALREEVAAMRAVNSGAGPHGEAVVDQLLERLSEIAGDTDPAERRQREDVVDR